MTGKPKVNAIVVLTVPTRGHVGIHVGTKGNALLAGISTVDRERTHKLILK
jgi:hypothetical protein